jgi:hypothetical protein
MGFCYGGQWAGGRADARNSAALLAIARILRAPDSLRASTPILLCGLADRIAGQFRNRGNRSTLRDLAALDETAQMIGRIAGLSGSFAERQRLAGEQRLSAFKFDGSDVPEPSRVGIAEAAKGLSTLSPQSGQVPRYGLVHTPPVQRAALNEWAAGPKVLMKVLMKRGGPGKQKAHKRVTACGLLSLCESGRRDLNPRPPEPHSGALPGCATSR